MPIFKKKGSIGLLQTVLENIETYLNSPSNFQNPKSYGAPTVATTMRRITIKLFLYRPSRLLILTVSFNSVSLDELLELGVLMSLNRNTSVEGILDVVS